MDSPDTSMVDSTGAKPVPDLRRRLLGAGIIGLAGSLLPSMRAHASSGTDAATTTTAPPQRPTSDDVVLLQFVQSLEQSAVSLYDVALASNGLGDELVAVLTQVRASHLAYVQSLSAMLGTNATTAAASGVVDAARDSFASGQDVDTATAAHDLENVAVATHTDVLAQLSGTDAAALVASILVVEARHSLVFGTLAGIDDPDVLLLTNADALAPEKA
jgi:Ferritin-like domain